LIRLDAGASTPPGETGSVMMRFIYEGGAEYGGQHCQAVSSLYYPPDARYEGMYSPMGATMLSVELQLGPDSGLPLPYRV